MIIRGRRCTPGQGWDLRPRRRGVAASLAHGVCFSRHGNLCAGLNLHRASALLLLLAYTFLVTGLTAEVQALSRPHRQVEAGAPCANDDCLCPPVMACAGRCCCSGGSLRVSSGPITLPGLRDPGCPGKPSTLPSVPGGARPASHLPCKSFVSQVASRVLSRRRTTGQPHLQSRWPEPPEGVPR